MVTWRRPPTPCQTPFMPGSATTTVDEAGSHGGEEGMGDRSEGGGVRWRRPDLRTRAAAAGKGRTTGRRARRRGDPRVTRRPPAARRGEGPGSEADEDDVGRRAWRRLHLTGSARDEDAGRGDGEDDRRRQGGNRGEGTTLWGEEGAGVGVGPGYSGSGVRWRRRRRPDWRRRTPVSPSRRRGLWDCSSVRETGERKWAGVVGVGE
ncbi:hypothetical protein U9M48_037139 [Paspalum notatum var. saurae]|uniref:Uncharacterized protein n=1 Tax=Paspalum notatum var. saurae TaxID=547442 RepID=A0AAQ3X9M4_PASNO